MSDHEKPSHYNLSVLRLSVLWLSVLWLSVKWVSVKWVSVKLLSVKWPGPLVNIANYKNNSWLFVFINSDKVRTNRINLFFILINQLKNIRQSQFLWLKLLENCFSNPSIFLKDWSLFSEIKLKNFIQNFFIRKHFSTKF